MVPIPVLALRIVHDFLKVVFVVAFSFLAEVLDVVFRLVLENEFIEPFCGRFIVVRGPFLYFMWIACVLRAIGV